MQEGLEAQNENQNAFVEVKGLLLFYILISLFLCKIKWYFRETWRGGSDRGTLPPTEPTIRCCSPGFCRYTRTRMMDCLNCSNPCSKSQQTMYILETFLYRLRKNVSLKQAKSALIWGEGGSKTRLWGARVGSLLSSPANWPLHFRES